MVLYIDELVKKKRALLYPHIKYLNLYSVFKLQIYGYQLPKIT